MDSNKKEVLQFKYGALEKWSNSPPFLRQIAFEKNMLGENTIKGTLTQLECVKDFIGRGYMISEPVVQDCKYDYIVDINHKLLRIQCKSAKLSKDKNYISLKTKTTNIRTMKNTYYSEKDIDYFYSCYNGKGYLIPVSDAGHGETRLRFSSTQASNPNIRWASSYELDVMLNSIKEEVEG